MLVGYTREGNKFLCILRLKAIENCKVFLSGSSLKTSEKTKRQDRTVKKVEAKQLVLEYSLTNNYVLQGNNWFCEKAAVYC